MLRAVVLTQYRRVTDGPTDGIAVASTALAKWRAVIINRIRYPYSLVKQQILKINKSSAVAEMGDRGHN